MAGTEQARMHLAMLGATDPGDGDDRASEDERALLLRFRRGSDDAFGRFVQAYRAPVYSYLVRSGVRESERDDLFQDIFLKVAAAAGQYRPSRPLHPWLFTIVANTVRAHRRRERLRSLIFADGEGDDVRAENVQGERAIEARQTVAWLERQIARLPEIQREVLLLTCVQRLPQKEAAEVLGLRVNTLKTHLRRARLRLARRLKRRRGGEA